MMMTSLNTSPPSMLGVRCAETLLRRIEQLSIASSNRHVIDYLPSEAATALFEALMARADQEVSVPIPDDNGRDADVQLAALQLSRAQLIPFFVTEPSRAAASGGLKNRGSEGFASCLRDHYAVGAKEPRYLLTITSLGNETQKSAQDATSDKVLVDLGLLLNNVLDARGIAADAPLRRVADVYLAFRSRGDSWSDIHARWERYVGEVATLPPEEQGARLPLLGCFLPDRSADFASSERRVRILPESEDQRRRRSGDPLSSSRLYDNAVLRAYLGEVFANPIHDPEQVLHEVFEEAQEKAQAILKGGRSGLDSLDLDTFSGMDQIQKRREKNAFLMDRVVVEGARHWLPFEHADSRFLVVAADSVVRIRLGLKRPFNSRKERAQIATWRADKNRLEPKEVRVYENATEVVFEFEAPTAGSFAVFRLALARGPRSVQKPIDSLLVAISGASMPELVVEEERQLSLEDQAWIAEEEPRFSRYTPASEPEPVSVASREEIGESPTVQGAQIVKLTFVESSQQVLVVGRRPETTDGSDDTGAFEHEKLLELTAYTVRVGERAREAFRTAECYLDAVHHVDEVGARWRVDLLGGISREIYPSRSREDEPDHFLYERAVARLLMAPETITLRWSREGAFQPASTLEAQSERSGRFFEARRATFEALRELAMKHVPRFRRNQQDVGVPLWLLPLHHIDTQVTAYLEAWCTAVDEALAAKRYEAVHDRLLQLDTLLLEDNSQIQRLVLLPTNPWLLASLRHYQTILAENFRAKEKRLPLRRDEVEQLVPKTALEDWYIAQGGGARLRLTDGAPFHLEFLPEEQHKSRGTLDYVERVVANKVERYLRMHPHLRNDRRTLRIGFVNPGDGRHLLEGIRAWLINLMRERSGRLRLLPSEEIPSIDVFLFSTRDDDSEVGSAFEQFFRQKVTAADEDVVQQTMVARLRYRKSAQKIPMSPADAVHICFVHALVDAKKQSNRTGPLDEWWDGGFGDGLLSTYLRRAMPGASGQLHSRRGLWLDPNSTGLRGALARLVALQRGCRDSDLERSKAIYWECPLPQVGSLANVYKHSDWVIHLDRELSLDLFTRDRDADTPMIIEYSDQEVPSSPGYDTITVTRYADPYREQLGEILTTVALDIQGRGDAARRAAHAILEDINVLSGSWALDFLMGSIAGKRYSLRLKGNIGSALVYRWLKRVEFSAYGRTVLETNVGKVVPVVISLEELLRVTPAAGLSQKGGLVHRYTNEYEEKDKDSTATKFCDDLLVLYVTASTPGAPSRLYGRIIEVKFGTTAMVMSDKAVVQVRNTHELLQRHLSGRSAPGSVEAPFRHKQLSLLLKAQLEQAVAMGVLQQPDVYEFLNIPALSANLATGNYEVDYTLGVDDQHVLGDVFLLDTRDPESGDTLIKMDNGVRVVTLQRTLVEWLTFERDDSPTLRGRPENTLPRLGRYQNVKTQTGISRRVSAAAPSQLVQTFLSVEAAGSVPPAAADSAAQRSPDIATERVVGAAKGAPAASAPEAVAAATASPDVMGTIAMSEPTARISLEEACRAPVKDAPYPDSAVVEVVHRLERALKGHKVALASPLSARETDRGPRLLRVYLRLEPGESINSLRRISEDLARDVGTESADLHITNVPERHAVGIDLPLKGLTYGVSFPELVAHASFAAAEEELSLGFCAGIDVTGRPVWADLAQMPHMLVAGTTGSGKTVFLRNVILTLLMHNTADRMVLRLSSSKPMDFRIFAQAPHAGGAPMATDASAALHMAQQLVEEMDRRIKLISDAYCDNLAEYNRENSAQAMPFIVGIFDEYAEMIASFGDRQERTEFEAAMGRLAQKARAAGIHLIICMQRPDANALKGAIKANILHRFALKLPQQHDSQIILDEGGAETLLGRGDLLYKDASNRVYRLQVPDLDNTYLKSVLRSFSSGSSSPLIDLNSTRRCPKCGQSGTIREMFGTRRTRHRRRDGSEVIAERVQSYCTQCRTGAKNVG